MLFVCVARHTPEMCPGGLVRPDKEALAKAEKAVKDSGAKLVGSYLDAGGHTFYFIVDAATNAQLWDATEPLRLYSEIHYAPVMTLADASSHARKIGIQK